MERVSWTVERQGGAIGAGRGLNQTAIGYLCPGLGSDIYVWLLIYGLQNVDILPWSIYMPRNLLPRSGDLHLHIDGIFLILMSCTVCIY